MPEQRTCEGCGDLYWWPKGSWQHEGCASNGHLTASNEVIPEIQETPPKVTPAVHGINGTKQRWSRESYNAYMRDYMKRRRGEKGI